MRDSSSTPITSTVSAMPMPIALRAAPSAKMNPEHAANRSHAAARLAPSLACSVQAHEGRMRSGVVVPTMI